ncbi:hypothetical protein NDU88_002630 [Pleurodeles waltl]|uniref:Uncharacterized protein n=1 Tax=Pleurodeles waltl TaxID=8319 RepID=A0AAV7TL65_PLEWA|nr:hypothetical protein NDU88_002630 [Pleurodeles waltl]
MGKERGTKGAQQTKMDQFMAQQAGEESQCTIGGLPGEVSEPSVGQILAAREASGQAVQTQIAAIAIDNLLRTDLCAVAERSVATEKQRAAYQVRFLSDHAPLVLECETPTPRPAISLWHLHLETLRDPDYRVDVLVALQGYISENWNMAQTRRVEWKTLKVVVRGVGREHSKTVWYAEEGGRGAHTAKRPWSYCSVE